MIPALKRDIATKFSAGQFSDSCERKAQALAALNCSVICQVHDVGPHYLITEYIEGAPPMGACRLHRALNYSAQIYDALGPLTKRAPRMAI